ncbi:MAG TPA: CHAD domain-containing protein [Ignavibacteria bacterium]|jgi:CHAD domain-containing protein
MKKNYPVKKRLSLKENIQIILPLMYDDLMLYKQDVVTKPLAKNTLHRMRITGKPLRYAMEIGEVAFGEEFSKCYIEVKNAVELMGEIHDADVMIPELGLHLKEIRLFNQTIPVFKERISTKGIRKIMEVLKQKRREMYAELCKTLNEWESTNFRKKLLNSMDVKQADQFETAGGI